MLDWRTFSGGDLSRSRALSTVLRKVANWIVMPGRLPGGGSTFTVDPLRVFTLNVSPGLHPSGMVKLYVSSVPLSRSLSHLSKLGRRDMLAAVTLGSVELSDFVSPTGKTVGTDIGCGSVVPSSSLCELRPSPRGVSFKDCLITARVESCVLVRR